MISGKKEWCSIVSQMRKGKKGDIRETALARRGALPNRGRSDGEAVTGKEENLSKRDKTSPDAKRRGRRIEGEESLGP